MTGQPQWSILPSPLGELLAVQTAGGLSLLAFTPHDRFLVTAAARWTRSDEEPLFDRMRAQLIEYFAGQRREFDLPLTASGSTFQQQVWQVLRQIPYGATWSYGDVAARLGLGPQSARAVGAANGANPVPIVVPCHRVIGADGGLTGFAGGLQRKRFLLDLESDLLF